MIIKFCFTGTSRKDQDVSLGEHRPDFVFIKKDENVYPRTRSGINKRRRLVNPKVSEDEEKRQRS